MKAVSLWQPWASLIAYGMKTCETRSWPTKHRGPLAIHAAKRPFDIIPLLNGDDALHWRAAMRTIDHDMPRGCVVAVVDLLDCVPIQHANADVSESEVAFGDYTPGRFRWDLSLIWKPENAIEVRGRQQLFDIDDAILLDAGYPGGAA